jgi:DNA-binding NarL/FixJ family response regulator
LGESTLDAGYRPKTQNRKSKIINSLSPLHNLFFSPAFLQCKLNQVYMYMIENRNKPLSRREQEIFNALLTGVSNKEISEKYFISINTVKTHIKKIYHKMGLKNRIELMSKFKN